MCVHTTSIHLCYKSLHSNSLIAVHVPPPFLVKQSFLALCAIRTLKNVMRFTVDVWDGAAILWPGVPESQEKVAVRMASCCWWWSVPIPTAGAGSAGRLTNRSWKKRERNWCSCHCVKRLLLIKMVVYNASFHLASQLLFESRRYEGPGAHVLRLLLAPDKLCDKVETSFKNEHYHVL